LEVGAYTEGGKEIPAPMGRTNKIIVFPKPGSTSNLATMLARRVIGQPAAMTGIIPYVQMHEAGLAPEGRPVGVFLLLGPSGTGKTKTVEALADVLHGSERNLLRVDCGEFQMEHEVAKLIGAPPGYLGHRETHPMLTQQKLNAVTSERSNLSLVLFDEIEKSATTLTRLLLGVLDKAALRLGDNTTVNFERSLIFLTSNLGAREMLSCLKPGYGLEPASHRSENATTSSLERIGLAAVRKRFAPEFVNRIDAVITYQPLSRGALDQILDLQLHDIQRHLQRRLGMRAFSIDVSRASRTFLLDRGVSQDFGARELKRTLHRHVMHPLAAMVAADNIPPHSTVRIDLSRDRHSLRFRVQGEPDERLRPAS
jgi:ATP-dependent Clp protease ATP-binding subunit ClpA